MNETVKLTRSCDVIEIPSGRASTLPDGMPVRIMQSRGDSYTVWSDWGQMYRVEGKDADALGMQAHDASSAENAPREFSEEMVWDVLKSVYDPEIPVNIVDLGLIYECKVAALNAPADESAAKRIDIKMSMTAPGCGMGGVLKADVESRLARLPSVQEVQVEVVLDPPWDMSRMSEAARLQLGL